MTEERIEELFVRGVTVSREVFDSIAAGMDAVEVEVSDKPRRDGQMLVLPGGSVAVAVDGKLSRWETSPDVPEGLLVPARIGGRIVWLPSKAEVHRVTVGAGGAVTGNWIPVGMFTVDGEGRPTGSFS